MVVRLSDLCPSCTPTAPSMVCLRGLGELVTDQLKMLSSASALTQDTPKIL
jgi:hypothetical protein